MLEIKDISPRVIEMQYAVRGPLVAKAAEMEKAGTKILKCNIGNPQDLGQKPLSYIRQTLALVTSPDLIEADSKAADGTSIIPDDLKKRAAEIISVTKTVGRYTESLGLEYVRKQVAAFIAARDGIPVDPAYIMLTDGASPGVKNALQAIIASEHTGIMIPVPRYPLYSATITALGGQAVGYYLDEERNWSTDIAEMERAYAEATEKGIEVKALVIINPGNPTGAVLSKETIIETIKFAEQHNLTILADEVYQTNIFGGNTFHSFAKYVHELGASDVSLISFHSGSKAVGECGLRMGYMEMRNIPRDVYDQLVKIQSVSLCSNHIGQIATGLMVTPPKPGDASFATYDREYREMQADLEAKGGLMYDGLNAIPHMKCAQIQGAMYAFPSIFLPAGKTDADYCQKLLEETGILFVPGSGFGQKPGTNHFRTTLLPPREEIEAMLEKLSSFHIKYTAA
ncbi:MAG TPA: aminotransferase class I/II-fold pyridoxal phosphate-dependent enzyme [bacterium]|nr:aminotransferase class I/II-fold pyridoxal phosphate-dependent enzyme [bacterium]